MQYLIDAEKTPRGGFRYVHKETGTIFTHINYIVLKQRVRSFFHANNYPVGLLWDEEFQNEVCSHIPAEAGQCGHKDPNMAPVTNPEVEPDDVKAYLKTTMAWMKAGMPYVEQELATKRASICKMCPYNQPVKFGCTACSKIPTLITETIGGRSTPLDNDLRACGVCKCQLKAAVHIPVELKVKYMTKAMIERLPSFCWIKNEVKDANL